MKRSLVLLLALCTFLCVRIDSLPSPELRFRFIERHVRQQDNSTSGGSGSINAGQSQQMKPPEQLINPALSSGGSPQGSSSGSGSQMTNPGGVSSGSSQQLSQQFSPQGFVDPSFQNNAGMTSSNSSKPSSFIDPSQFLQAGSAFGLTGSTQSRNNQTSSGTNAGSGNSGFGSLSSNQLFKPPNQFFGQESSGQFNFFNPASFVGK